MNQYTRQFLRDRYLAEQQTQLAEDSKIDDPAQAYRALVDELYSDDERDKRTGRAA